MEERSLTESLASVTESLSKPVIGEEEEEGEVGEGSTIHLR